MAVLDNTSGHLQLEHLRIRQTPEAASVHVTMDLHPPHHLLEMITSVSQGMCILGTAMEMNGTASTPMTLSGMVKTVTPPVHVALSTILHISPKPSTRQLAMSLS